MIRKYVPAIVISVAAVLVGLAVAVIVRVGTQAPVTSVSVPSPTEDSVTVDYRHGAWYIDGYRVPLSCPQEDDCTVDYTRGAWVFALDPTH